MKVILFGGTGMVGQGVLRECLLAPDVEEVLSIGRTPIGQADPKLRELIRPDLADLTPVESELGGYDACFFCLGVSSVGMNESTYRRITYDLTLAAATVISRQNPDSTFVYVSGQGTDSTEKGRSMWARVKGKTENDLRALPLKTYLFRPGFIQALHGVRPKVRSYATIYRVVAPIAPLLVRTFPGYMTTSEEVGKAMLEVARRGAPTPYIGNREMHELSTRS